MGAADSLAARCPVLVVDEHRLISSTMVLALESRGLEAYCCEVSSRSEILATAAALPPGIVLLDLDLGQDADGQPMSGIDLIGDLRADGWRVVVLTGCADDDRLAAAVTAGADGVFLKKHRLAGLLELIEQAATGRLLMPPVERRKWLEEHRRNRAESSRIDLLTARERDVLERLAAGQRATAIAEDCEVSITTVRTHIRSILAKLAVRSQLEAVAFLRPVRNDASR